MSEVKDRRIYFIADVDRRFVKIGISRNLSDRLHTIQDYCPFELELIFDAPGELAVEKALHEKFNKDRIRREWFVFSDDIWQYIVEMSKRLDGNLPTDNDARNWRHLWSVIN